MPDEMKTTEVVKLAGMLNHLMQAAHEIGFEVEALKSEGSDDGEEGDEDFISINIVVTEETVEEYALLVRMLEEGSDEEEEG